MSWTLQNLVVLSLLALGAWIVRSMRRREYWRLAGRELLARRGAVVSGAILAAYLVVALLDSVGWRNAERDPETGEVRRNPQTGEVIYDRGRSVLDRMLAPLAARQELYYSAPLAAEAYIYEAQEGEGGAPRRVHPALRHPRAHLLGTDRIGNDVLLLSIKSIRTGIIIGLLTTLIAIPFALLMGILAGYYGGWLDDIIQYIYTVVSSIPTVLFVAAFIVIFGVGLPQLCVAMGLASWTSLCRLLRAETLRLRESEFVAAAVALGTPSWRILLRHILPNVLHVVIITTVLRFSSEVLAEALLTYLGIGVGAQTMSWGVMINDARSELTRDPVIWWKLAAAFVFMLGLVLPANLFGDAVRDALDPRLRTQ
ncbi:MAG: ABC transporter permease [Victivallales bacterium]|nr:ABC transporter permease [Victivallales bacterium]